LGSLPADRADGCSSEELSGRLRERTILQFERGGQFGILVVADYSISGIVPEHDPVFVAVPGAAADQPDVCQLRVPIDDEVIVDAVFALADLAVDERLPGEQREPFGHELSALA